MHAIGLFAVDDAETLAHPEHGNERESVWLRECEIVLCALDICAHFVGENEKRKSGEK